MKLPLNGPYDFTFGLGQNCANAGYMTRYDLRACSSPFDWLDGRLAGLKVCIELICNDFRGFLEKRNLLPVPNQMREIDDKTCDYYQDSGTGFLAMHEFPHGVPLDESYPKVMGKLRRRVERLYRLVQESHHSLFIYWSRFESVPSDELVELANRLRARFAGSKVDLLVIENRDSASGIESVEEVAKGVVRVVGRFFVQRADNLVMGDEKLNGEVYSAIPRSFSLKVMGWKRRLIRASVRTVTAFILNRTRRKAVRKALLLKYVGKETV